jgi:hypothetical protein
MNKDSFVALPTREQDVDIKLVQLRILSIDHAIIKRKLLYTKV